MTHTLLRLTVLGLSTAGLAACATPAGHPPAQFGDAVRANIALHTVNPDGPKDPELTFDGERRALMIERYVADKVEEPGPAKTSDSGAGG